MIRCENIASNNLISCNKPPLLCIVDFCIKSIEQSWIAEKSASVSKLKLLQRKLRSRHFVSCGLMGGNEEKFSTLAEQHYSGISVLPWNNFELICSQISIRCICLKVLPLCIVNTPAITLNLKFTHNTVIILDQAYMKSGPISDYCKYKEYVSTRINFIVIVPYDLG